jgi:thiamine-phosphate pyrophosphorylase
VSASEGGSELERADPQLLLFLPAALAPGQLETALAVAPVAAVIASSGAPGSLHEVTRRAGRALLVLDDLGPAKGGAADGVHLRSSAGCADARRQLGDAALIGAEAGLSRHAAMVAGEDGADYVMFGLADPAHRPDLDQLTEMAAWWSELFVLPCAAAGVGSPDAVDALVRAGADFIAVGPEIWADPAGAETMLKDFAAALQSAGRNGPP